ncbi:MAG: DoxX family protein [Chitinophagaceae bacterium]|nr:MAG: DoxX family protein [Chitinophagaceae bacterium]
MKSFTTIARILVGVLFIFSGLVKANDPLGLSYKMQEFFEIWGMVRFDHHTLWLSVAMNAFEIIAGFALLIGWRIPVVSWLLLLLIIFFTFLTGYTYVTGKPVNCGCFGDCLPITSKTSFLKDVVLTVLIIFIFIRRYKIRPVFPALASGVLMLLVTAFSFLFQWYTLTYLPVVDCLPFKKGNNIPQQMKPPAGAVTDSFAIMFVYEKGGREFEFAPASLPADLDTYTYVRRSDRLVRQGNAMPPIKGFALSGISGEDSTDIILSAPRVVLLFCENFDKPVSGWSDAFENVYRAALAKNIPVYAISNTKDLAKKLFEPYGFRDLQVFSCDNTAIRTAARTNPCLYYIENGTVVEKAGMKQTARIVKQFR